jgi:hypothetical protein
MIPVTTPPALPQAMLRITPVLVANKITELGEALALIDMLRFEIHELRQDRMNQQHYINQLRKDINVLTDIYP